MAQRYATASCGLALAAALAADPAAADPAADEAAIRQRLADWVAAFNARDARGACDLFAPDLSYAVPDVVDGTQTRMCGNLAEVLARDEPRLSYALPEIHEVIVSGDLAVVRLTWTLTATGPGERAGATEISIEEGMDVFRRQEDGRWSIARYIAFDRAPGPP
jgi:steroid delta-isomerase